MKTKLLLMLFVCGACFSCNAPQQDKQELDSTKVNKRQSDKSIYNNEVDSIIR